MNNCKNNETIYEMMNKNESVATDLESFTFFSDEEYFTHLDDDDYLITFEIKGVNYKPHEILIIQ